MAAPKRFALSKEQIKPLLPSKCGGGMASDRIMVDGVPIGYMYRSCESANPVDTGWRFLAGDETPEDLNDVEKCGVYSLNTIANYDSDIIPYLQTPAPCAFEKIRGTHRYRPVDPPVED